MKILYLEACDFIDYPTGGTLSFAKQFINNIDGEIQLVGLASENDPIGVWFEKTINSKKYNFYSIGAVEKVKKSRLPKRMVTFFLLKKHLENLYFEDVDLVFTQTPQFVFLLKKYKWKRFCFCFAGLGNSVGLSKYKVLRVFGGIYEKYLFKCLKSSCDIILAAADQNSISNKEKKYNMSTKSIIPFPTRFNDKVFYPIEKVKTRKELKLKEEAVILITVGRLSYIKGWKDLIDSYRIIKTKLKEAILIFVGDGEDREEIIKYCQREIMSKEIILTGRKSHKEIASFLNASDLFVMTSLIEGWPTSMVEALACGKNIVSSNVSGAKEMILPNKNGIIVYERSPVNFANAILNVISFPNPNPISIELSKNFAASKLNEEFQKIIK